MQTREPKKRTNQEVEQPQPFKAEIKKLVLQALGEPVGLHGVQVKMLWEDHYRVNVFVGLDAVSARIARSYFLVTDSSGNILTSNPTMTRLC
jgi:hypothetical protein